jgi:hypothetical protein
MDIDTFSGERDAVVPLRAAISRLHGAQRAMAWDDHRQATELVQEASAACQEWLARVGDGRAA